MRGQRRSRTGTGHGGRAPQAGDRDAELLAAVADAHLDALRLLHQRHAPWLRARLARRCADPDAVDTAIQETFLAVWQGGARRYRPYGDDAGGWLWTIAVRKEGGLRPEFAVGTLRAGRLLLGAGSAFALADDLAGTTGGALLAVLFVASRFLPAYLSPWPGEGIPAWVRAGQISVASGGGRRTRCRPGRAARARSSRPLR